MNGLMLHVEASEGVHFMEITLISERANLKAITDWLESHIKPTR
jgi:hypothetical protein